MPSPSERISESSMTDLWNLWFTELHRRRVGLTIKIKQLLYTAKSPYQRIDVLYTDRALPPAEIGDLLIVPGMGAYTNASASTFNGFPLTRLVAF